MFSINDYINVSLYALKDENYYKEKNNLMNQFVDCIWNFYIDYIKNNQNFNNDDLKNDIINLTDDNYKKLISNININLLYEQKKYKNKLLIDFLKKIHEYNIINKFTKIFSIQNEHSNDNINYNIKYNIIISYILNNLKKYIPNFLMLTGLYPHYEYITLINKKISNLNDYMYHFGTESFIFNIPKLVNKNNIYYFFYKSGVEYTNVTLIYETLNNIVNHEIFINIENGYLELFNIIFQVIRALYISYKKYNFSHGNLLLENVIINKLKEEYSIKEYDEILNISKKYNFNYEYQNVNYIAYIYNYDYSQINLEKPIIIKDDENNDIEVSRINRYYYRAVDDMSTSLHDVFKYLLSINMMLNKIKFNTILNDIQKNNIEKMLNLMKNVFLNFFFSENINYKELEYLYLIYEDKSDNYKISKNLNINTKYIYPQSLLDNELLFENYIEHIFKNIRENNYDELININFSKKYTNLKLENNINEDYSKNLEIINENIIKVYNNMDIIINHIDYIINNNSIPDELNIDNLNINIKQLTIKLCIFYIFYILIFILILKEYIFHINKLNVKFNDLFIIDKKYINFIFWIFTNFEDSEYFKSCFNDYDSLKNYLYNFYNINIID